MYPDYSPQEIEAKWQQAWEAAGLYRAAEPGDKPKFYCLDFFPYPSGEGLHVGHCRNYIPTDVVSRFKRMQGYNVLHPMGWDAFGEPAEQYAVEHGVHPRRTTDQNTANFRRQMTLIDAGYDWSREAEHAVLHLLYARFWTHVLADAGLVPFREPFARLLNQGQLIAPDSRRMSKSRGNVITPDSMVDTYGADALRVYELFMAPFDQDVAWNAEDILGARRFLNRVGGVYLSAYPGIIGATGEDPALERLSHKAIRRISERIETFRFNTVVSTLMEFANLLAERQRSGAWQTRSYHRALEALLVLLAPVAPHIAEELWEQTGHPGSVHLQAWPAWDAVLAQDERLQIPVQVDGKVRQVIEMPLDATQEDVAELAFSQSKVQDHLKGRQILRIHYIPGKILSIVTRQTSRESGMSHNPLENQ